MSSKDMDAAAKTICVIGAGASGLAAIKACKEEGLLVQCYEKIGRFGGVWSYADADVAGQPSVMKSTVINSSKEMSAFSDFPPPDSFANYMHNSYMLEYFGMYAERFDLLRHVRYRREVVSVDAAANYDVTGRWIVTIKDLEEGGEQEVKTFDGVMVCSGHHTFPYSPTLPGLEEFGGRVLHTHSLKSSTGFEDQRVLVVGIGNSAADAAVEVCQVSKKLYLSTRRGSWLLSRMGPGGVPFDSLGLRRIMNFFLDWNGPRIADWALESFLNLRFDHARYGLQPKHHVLSAHPTMNDALPNFILSGRTVIKQDIHCFTREGVVFEGEESVTPLDAVILATGYLIKFPFIPETVLKIEDNCVNLYKLMFPPQLPHPSLAFIGLIQPLGSIFPISEAQSRWFAHMLRQNSRLPPLETMEADIETRNNRNCKRYVSSPRHTIQVMWISFMDEICAQFGAKPSLWKLALTDPRLFWACVWGPCTPYQYRLQGPHSWDGARDAILTTWDRIQAPFDTRKSN